MAGYNLPDNVSASDPRAPWNQDEGGYYFEISLYHLIAECGGREEIIGHDEPYHYMIGVQERMIKELLRSYDEVGELHPETIQDYVDSITMEE